MSEEKPKQGGVVSVLQVFALLEVFGAFLGGAAANLSLGVEVILMISAALFAALLWGAGSVIQELRTIAFNTKPKAPAP